MKAKEISENQEKIEEEQENVNEIYKRQNARLQSRIEEIEKSVKNLI